MYWTAHFERVSLGTTIRLLPFDLVVTSSNCETASLLTSVRLYTFDLPHTPEQWEPHILDYPLS